MTFPMIRNVGVTGALVSFADTMSAEASRAARAFAEAVPEAGIDGVTETAPTLTGCYIGLDPLRTGYADLEAALAALLKTRDWLASEELPGRHWRVPVAFGDESGPQLEEVAKALGLSPEEVVSQITSTNLSVLMLGFAPGQPYLGHLPQTLHLPRQSGLTAEVPAGAVVTAIGQITIFDAPAPTGWRWIGRTALPLFRLDAGSPFTLAPGDRLDLIEVSAERLAQLTDDPMGGAEVSGP